jgi:multidrug resistance efflux pump
MLETEHSRQASSEKTAQNQSAPASVSAMPQWNVLADAGDATAFCSAWLALQCSRILGVSTASLTIRHPDTRRPLVSVTWPAPDLDLGDVKRIAERAYAERRAIVSPGRIGPDTSPVEPVGLLIAVPVGAGGNRIGVVCVAMATSRGATTITPESVIEQLQWGAGWLETVLWARRYKDLSETLARAASSLDLLAAVGEQQRLQGMTIAIANDLVTRLRCERASVGVIRRGGSVRLRAISRSAAFRSKGRLVATIESAMEEAVDQRCTVVHPELPQTKRAVAMAHRALADLAKVPAAQTMSVVLADGAGQPVGAITIERHHEVPFDRADLQLMETIAALVGPMFGLQVRANRLVAGRIVDVVGDAAAAVIGPRRPALKIATFAGICLAIALLFATGEHRVTAKSVLEAEVQRAAVAPFDGYVRSAPVRAGDTVAAGELLASLDDRDLVLEQLKWRAERDKLVQRQRDALAKHDRSNIVVLEPQIRQAESQLGLADEKLSRTRILAPFAGIVVSGDLSQMLGSPVEKGKILFEIAPLNFYRLIVHVDERDVRYIAVGQKGTVVFAGMPGRSLALTLSKITPVTVAEEGRNSYRVEARLAENDDRLRPGLEGVAKLDVGPRSIFWIWTHGLFEWLKLIMWKYLP